MEDLLDNVDDNIEMVMLELAQGDIATAIRMLAGTVLDMKKGLCAWADRQGLGDG